MRAAELFDWSSGSIEGAVNRIKKIKRQLYGRAGFVLLRKLILLPWHSETPLKICARTERQGHRLRRTCGSRPRQVPSRGRMTSC